MIAKLAVTAQCLPEWFEASYPANIPLPDEPVRPLSGEVVAWAEHADQRIPLLAIDHGHLSSQYDWQAWRTYILEERYRQPVRPFYTRLPFHYHRVPAAVRQWAAGRQLRRLAASSIPRTSFPGFPIEQGFELLNHVYHCLTEPVSPPIDQPDRVILTHDIDTWGGFRAIRQTARLEMSYGFRSLWNVVGGGYPIDFALLDWLAENDFEIGLHGYNHDNKLIFLPESKIRQRLDRCAELIARYQIKSFRSPCWFRSPGLYRVLSDYFQRDYSSLDADISCPGGNGGCLWTKPFVLGGLTHIPTTLPFEVPGFFGDPPQRWVEFWRAKIEWLRACGGSVVVNTHPDPHRSGNSEALAAYDELLALLNEPAGTSNWTAATTSEVMHANPVL